MTPEERDRIKAEFKRVYGLDIDELIARKQEMLDDCLFLDPENIEGFHRSATSDQLLDEFRGTQGPVLIVRFTPDERRIQWLTNGTPGDALAMASQFINVMSSDGEPDA